jgi:hypothetical protein
MTRSTNLLALARWLGGNANTLAGNKSASLLQNGTNNNSLPKIIYAGRVTRALARAFRNFAHSTSMPGCNLISDGGVALKLFTPLKQKRRGGGGGIGMIIINECNDIK